MKRITRIFEWIKDFWPIFFILFVGIIHSIALRYLSIPDCEINEFVSSLTQLGGAVITLIIVSNNFAQFRHMTFFSWLRMKAKTFPLRKQHYKLEVGSSQHSFLSGEVRMTVKRGWDDVDEGLKELERRIDELRVEVIERNKDIKKDIDSLRQKLNNSIKENSQKITEVQTLLEWSVLDDIHFQILGAFLILYGFFIEIIFLK